MLLLVRALEPRERPVDVVQGEKRWRYIGRVDARPGCLRPDLPEQHTGLVLPADERQTSGERRPISGELEAAPVGEDGFLELACRFINGAQACVRLPVQRVKAKAEVRPTTCSARTCASAPISSSVSPSLKYSCLGSPLRLAHGRTAMAFELAAAPSVAVPGRALVSGRNQTSKSVRSFQYAPGAYTGWHTHPGPVFIMVLEGTVTFYGSDDPDCKPVVVRAGETFLDTGEHAHIGHRRS